MELFNHLSFCPVSFTAACHARAFSYTCWTVCTARTSHAYRMHIMCGVAHPWCGSSVIKWISNQSPGRLVVGGAHGEVGEQKDRAATASGVDQGWKGATGWTGLHRTFRWQTGYCITLMYKQNSSKAKPRASPCLWGCMPMGALQKRGNNHADPRARCRCSQPSEM